MAREQISRVKTLTFTAQKNTKPGCWQVLPLPGTLTRYRGSFLSRDRPRPPFPSWPSGYLDVHTRFTYSEYDLRCGYMALPWDMFPVDKVRQDSGCLRQECYGTVKSTATGSLYPRPCWSARMARGSHLAWKIAHHGRGGVNTHIVSQPRLNVIGYRLKPKSSSRHEGILANFL